MSHIVLVRDRFQLAVHGFGEQIKQLQLIRLHPGVNIDDAQSNGGFEVLMPEKVAESNPTTSRERKILREIAPSGILIN